VFHRIQPVIETVILPTKHYIHSPDGKSLIEVSEDQIPGRSGLGAASRNWKIVPTRLGEGDYSPPSRQSKNSYVAPRTIASTADDYESRTSSHEERGNDPVLADKRESISPEGVPRTEYLWRHKPTYENVRQAHEPHHVAVPQPSSAATTIGQGHGRRSDSSGSSNERAYVLDDARSGHANNAQRHVRDSGYGSGDLTSKMNQMSIGVGNNRPYDPMERATIDRTPREVRTKKSSVDLRRVAGEQSGVRV